MARSTLPLLALALAAVLAACSAAASAPPRRTAAFFRAARSSREWSVPEDGEITFIPGADFVLPSQHYGGYVTLRGGTRRLYYYLVMSQGDFLSDPVVLWLQGGPGCSTFDGWCYEHGPFLFSSSTNNSSTHRLAPNPYAWSRAATIIYVDSPVGVGLSYEEGALPHATYITNDTRTAADADAFLRELLKRYAHLSSLPLFVSGESYAGIYVPNLAAELLRGNREGRQPRVNLKGYLVGNGVTDARFDGDALPPFAVGKSLVAADDYVRLVSACGGARFWDADPGSDCAARLARVRADVAELNIYDVLEECHHHQRPQPELTERRAAATRAAVAAGAEWPAAPVLVRGARVRNWAQLLGYDPPCTDSSAANAFLNDADVRRAIRAAPADGSAGRWALCARRVEYTHDAGSMLRTHEALVVEHGLRALIYSGDHDMAVPHTGSEAWTADLARRAGLRVVAPWAPWRVRSPVDRRRQVAGYAVEWAVKGEEGEEGKGRLTYATVKGAGHMVPQNKPAEALELFRRFLAGERLSAA